MATAIKERPTGELVSERDLAFKRGSAIRDLSRHEVRELTDDESCELSK